MNLSSPANSWFGASQVAIIGGACRLPGASDEVAFWRMLDEGRCAVGPLPDNRWRAERFLHPRTSEPGFSYTFAGGYIDNPFAFDPSAFEISPREAVQIDPQQRLLLEVVSEALDDAGLTRSALAGAEVGVYVGASSLDYVNLHTPDPAAIDSHFMTGNTLSVISNRISYVFDFHGPSFTVDTACSSSLVAFAEAMAAIDSGRIDVAVVGGVNLLLSPAPFIGFSRASMLSPTGLCRPFSAKGDGYVRAEGAVALIICRLDSARIQGHRIRSIAVASGINSDGRTSGISLPSGPSQQLLLEQLYSRAGVDPDDLAFVEAHGTGTRVGDPAEAFALSGALGSKRSAPLPIGSVKSNIGHTEPASGLAGMLKAILALEHKKLPRSLHLDELNPDIDFAAKNLQAVAAPIELDFDRNGAYAGVSSFGFGGTNAHVILRAPNESLLPRGDAGGAPEFMVLSAHSRAALQATAGRYADAVAAGGADLGQLANALAWRRDVANHRLALPLDDADAVVGRLKAFAESADAPRVVTKTTAASGQDVCFVFSGNGSQWSGMGRAAFARDAAFRAKFLAVDEAFRKLSGWSLVEALDDADLAQRLRLTEVAQPLLFAIQTATVAALAEYGLRPAMVTGHSVGEVAAALAADALSFADAVSLVYHRSLHQEKARDKGKMAVIVLEHGEAQRLLEELDLPEVEIAAINSSASLTLSGPEAGIRALTVAASRRRIPARMLDLDYPFHSSLLDDLHGPIVGSLVHLSPRISNTAFISTVTGEVLAGDELGADYWWRNVRQPVHFRQAVEAAARLGAGVFIEIGPRPILTSNISDTLRGMSAAGDVIASLSEKGDKEDGNPIHMIVARALAAGAKLSKERVFGAAPTAHVALPAYPWQHQTFLPVHTSEGIDLYGVGPRHPLIGARLSQGSPEWRSLIDATIVPYLADHKIDGEIVMPASGLAEMALAVARELNPEGAIELTDFDLVQWLVIPEEAMREMSIRYDAETRRVDIRSRPRLGPDEWTLHARGRIGVTQGSPPPDEPRVPLPMRATASEVYMQASKAGLDYGAAFRRVLSVERDDDRIDIELAPTEPGTGIFTREQILHPVALDASFHPLFQLMKTHAGEKRAYLPVRFDRLRVYRDHAQAARAVVDLERSTDQSITVSIRLFDAEGQAIALLAGGFFRSIVLARRNRDDAFFHEQRVLLDRPAGAPGTRDIATAELAALAPAGDYPDAWIMLAAFSRALAHMALKARLGTAPVDFDDLVPSGKVAEGALPLAASLLEFLARVGLAQESDGHWALAEATGLPDPASILTTFAAEVPAASGELVLAAQALASLEGTLANGVPVTTRTELVELFESSSLLFKPVFDRMRSVIERLTAELAPSPLRIIVAEPGCIGIIRVLLPFARDGRVRICVVGSDRKALGHVAARVGFEGGIELLEADRKNGLPSGVVFDLGLAFAFAPVFGGDADLGRMIGQRLAPGGAFITLQPPQDPIFDLLFGASEGWYARSLDPQFPIRRIPSAAETERALKSTGFNAVADMEIGSALGSLIVASPERRAADVAAAAPVVALVRAPGLASDPLLGQLAQQMRRAGGSVHELPVSNGADHPVSWPDNLRRLSSGPVFDLVYAARRESGEDTDRIEGYMAGLATILEAAQAVSAPLRLWVLVRGTSGTSATAIDPFAEAIWAFARVAMNEYPAVEMRLVDVALDLTAEEGASRLAAAMDAAGPETEILIEASGTSALRAARGLPVSGAATDFAPASRLELPPRGQLAHFAWGPADRREPGPKEVEVEVAAAGLNFRDVMLAMGLLDEDILAGGLAGAVLGFECSGRVARVGSEVKDLKVGDAVMGFAQNSFASHVIAAADVFVPLPDGVDVEAAASIPVAFLTAWYALIHCAKLKAGEWVLIHGAAGGVGLAAMQIARARGAHIAASVGTADKRALVELMGAERIYDSRSLGFADAIAADLGGVDVVLNSLSGEAMLASVNCVKPFGRFIELGKRDYVANTSLGLRPFRRNLTYFGVDLDQLLAHDVTLVRRMMRALNREFGKGRLSPLPYRAFRAAEISNAFRLMQSAGHVGKIVVRPPSRPVAKAVAETPFVPGEGAHLVVGGTSGFGFETLAWLAAKGARKIVAASRRGRLDPALAARVELMRAAGTEVELVTLDVANAAAVETLIDGIVAKHGRLAGVIHAAMVLDDGLISGFDVARAHAVLAPKVMGAANLDRATRGAPLDYFVVYSSATTLIGSPGQGVYVGANAYLHGLMRRRRSEGLTGLAVAWGAISDVGILARNPETAKKLQRATGVAGMLSADAFDYLELLLGRPQADLNAIVYCATIRPSAATRELKVLRTPTFARAFTAADDSDMEDAVDVTELVAGKSDAEARAIIGGLITTEVARILRVSPEEIDANRPLSELGMDSLMGLELRMTVDKKFGVDLPIVAITSVKTLDKLAERMLAELRRPAGATENGSDTVSMGDRGLAERHASADVDEAGLAEVIEVATQRSGAVEGLL